MARPGHDAKPRGTAITDHVEFAARRVARTWTVAAIGTFAALGVTIGIPHGPDLEPWERLVQLVTLGLITLSGALAWRYEGLGGAMMLLGAAALWGMSALQHQPVVSFIPALVFVIPAVGFLVAWKRTKSQASLVVLATAVIMVLTIGGAAAYAVYQYSYGPSHPQSALDPLPQTPVVWIWSGAVTDTSATVVARVDGSNQVSLQLTDSSEPATTIPGTRVGNVWRFQLSGLHRATTYTYFPNIDGVALPQRSGQFTTFSNEPMSFTIAAASCARLGSNGIVYETIAGINPEMFIFTGDLFYADFATTPDHFESAYELSLSQPAQAQMIAAIPIAYVWDDHDVGRNDANSATDTLPLARSAYGQNVPHYPLLDSAAVYQSFAVGRVLFVLLDERTYRNPQTTPDGPNKTMLGTEQLQWLQDRLIEGRDRYAMTVLVTQVPWIAAAAPGADHWGGYAQERAVIANFIADNEIDNLMMLSGDAHMIAIDDGTNTDYSTSGNASFPLLQAAALDRPGSTKGGPYSEGVFPGGGQFGLIEVTDTGDSLQVRLRGMNWKADTLVEYSFVVETP